MESKPAKAPKAKKEADPSKPFVLKPKKPTSPWIYFNNQKVAQLKKEDGLDQKDAFTKSAEIWKTLTDDAKKPFIDKNKQDEERYKRQLAELEQNGFFMTEDGQKSTDLYVDPKKKYGESCVVPKKPLSAYLFYTTENVNSLKDKEGCTHPEAMKKCGELWNKLVPEEKKVYEAKHDKDVVRYKQQIQDLDKNGFFVMDDGSKSSEHVAKLKKRAKKSDGSDKPAKKQKKEKPVKNGEEAKEED